MKRRRAKPRRPACIRGRANQSVSDIDDELLAGGAAEVKNTCRHCEEHSDAAIHLPKLAGSERCPIVERVLLLVGCAPAKCRVASREAPEADDLIVVSLGEIDHAGVVEFFKFHHRPLLIA